MDSLGDKVLDKLHIRSGAVRDKLREQYKHTKPFRQEEVSNEEMLYHYSQLDADGIIYLVRKYGRDTVNQHIFEMEELKKRRQK